MNDGADTADPPDFPARAEPKICSATGCRARATYLLLWNNPKIHTADREKIWAACDDHRESLAGFLDLRGFLRRVEPIPPG